MADINKIKKEFIRIRDLGFVPSIAKYALSERNDGDAGETFQYYLSGIGRDNSKFADFDKWEVKTKRDTSTSATSLFSNAPSYPKNGDRVMLEKWGIPHEKYPNKLKLNTSLYANRFSKVHVRTKNVPTYTPIMIEISDIQPNEYPNATKPIEYPYPNGMDTKIK